MKHQKPDLIWKFYALQKMQNMCKYCVDCRYQMSDLRLCHTNFYALLSNSLHYFTKTPILTKILGVEKFDIDLEKTKRQTLLNSLLLPCWHFLKEKTLINFTRIQTTAPVLFTEREIVTNLVSSIKDTSMSLLNNSNHHIYQSNLHVLFMVKYFTHQIYQYFLWLRILPVRFLLLN